MRELLLAFGILIGASACSVDSVTFRAPGEAPPDAAPDSGADARCTAELCDGLDNDCSGAADDGAAIGAAAACPARSCVDVRDRNPASSSGVWWIAPRPTVPPFQVYCDQQTDGGGWGLVWKNHGGAKGGEKSNAALLASAAAGSGDPLVRPPLAGTTVELTSAIHQQMFDAYWGEPQREWIKITTLWDAANDQVVNRQHIRVVMRSSSMRSIFSAPLNRCFQVAEKLRVVVNGTIEFGETNIVNHYIADSFGLASTGNNDEDLCGQPADNLIDDPAPLSNSLYRVDGAANSTNGIRHLFSYTHSTAGTNASRCLYACWEMPVRFYDGWVWAVR